MTLEKILQSQGFGTRRHCRQLIESGRVSINQTVERDPRKQWQPLGLAFKVDGQSWQYQEKIYLVLNKPAGYECSHQPGHHPSIYRLLPEQFNNRGVVAAGRLDQDTTGLLLFSDDGAFIRAMTSPRKKLPKTYHARLKHPISMEQIARLTDGVLLHGETAAIAAQHAVMLDAHTLEVAVTEGKYHQVKRMVAAAGNRVEGLHRQAVGNLNLDPALESGQWRLLDKNEYDLLHYA